MENNIAVYGAYGHTGKFIVAQLCDYGYQPILCGRDEEKLRDLGKKYPGLAINHADINEPESLDAAFAEATIIVNCAGPFLDTARPVIGSALRLGKHYIDLSAEQKAVLDIFEEFSAPAEQAGIVVLPAAAFYGGLGDLLSTAVTNGWAQVDDITIYIGLDQWHPTKGTRLTGERNHHQRFVFADKQLQPLQAGGPVQWEFAAPVGIKEMLAVPLSEIITISRHIDVKNISTYISQNSIEDIRSAETPEPQPVDKKNRSAQLFFMEVVSQSGGKKRRITAHGRDIYAATAPLVVEAIDRILAGKLKRQGVTTLGETFDATDFLKSLREDDISISPIVES